MKFQELLDGWARAQQLDAVKKIAKNTAPQPQGKWQRLPDGTWGYPPQPQTYEGSPEQAFERGWRAGWAAGYEAAQAARQEAR